LPDPPPLPELPEIVTQDPVDLDALLEHVDKLYTVPNPLDPDIVTISS
jgi:hypothetical protein